MRRLIDQLNLYGFDIRPILDGQVRHGEALSLAHVATVEKTIIEWSAGMCREAVALTAHDIGG